MEFYPPLNVDKIFDRSIEINDSMVSKFGFLQPKLLSKSKSRDSVESKSFKSDLYLNRSKSQLHNSSIKVLRKLGLNESLFHGLNETNRSYIYRTVIITSEINLFENLEVVYKSINEWKSIHPLLKCKVISNINNEGEKYFAYSTDNKTNNNGNIHFYHYASNHSKSCDDVWKLLVERETTLPLSIQNGLLWRLTFFQVKITSNGNSKLFFYAVILTFDHSIMDGRSSYLSLLQLFSLIENNYFQIENNINEKAILPPKEEIFKTSKDIIENQPKFYIKAPDFLKLEKNDESSFRKLKNLTQEEEENGMIYTNENKPLISIKELINISKKNNSKFRTLIIKKLDFDKILLKCKENQVKLTTFINMCLVMAIRLIYEKKDYHLNYMNREEKICFTTNISLREFSDFKNFNLDTKNSIGCYIGLAFESFEKNLNYGKRNWVEHFWKICNEESLDFHKKLENREFIDSIRLPSRNKETDEFFYHFGNSNLGILESSISNKKMIRIKQTFATSRYSKENFLCWFSNLIATVDGHLCWTISYNTCFIKQDIINLLIENLTNITKELIK
ncbi:unnamed protein product [Brachionus calyciflorus]|uniref:Alcohol acetyltransferase n=1 Tax=Brachionus calyciflorus TaxID=104777 RepID=A0A813UQJ3_9BILA|nr:unnamed protein product [Brachionus calyciflorus]